MLREYFPIDPRTHLDKPVVQTQHISLLASIEVTYNGVFNIKQKAAVKQALSVFFIIIM